MEPFELEKYFAIHEFSAKYLLSSADAQSMSMKDLLAMANDEERDLWDNLWLGYTETQGLPRLRQAICDAFYPGLRPENILCFAGAEEGIYCAITALLTAKDHCIVMSPCYQSQKTIPETICDVTLVDLIAPHWTVDLATIEASIRPNTKMIVINFPHNPTGAIISRPQFDALIDLATRHDLWIFSDEVYRGLQTDDARMLPPVATTYSKGISLGVVSKSLGLAGLRIGWVALSGHTEIFEVIANTKHYLSICNSAPSEVLALVAIRNKDVILKRNNDLVRANMVLIESFMQKWSQLFGWCPATGGCTGFVHYRGQEILHMTLDEFADKCVTDFGVLILPGSKFPSGGLDVRSYFRFGFGRTNFPDGLGKFEEAIGSILATL
jgi:aspartate/methionine/tyrosine aminotransferase